MSALTRTYMRTNTQAYQNEVGHAAAVVMPEMRKFIRVHLKTFNKRRTQFSWRYLKRCQRPTYLPTYIPPNPPSPTIWPPNTHSRRPSLMVCAIYRQVYSFPLTRSLTHPFGISEMRSSCWRL